MVLVWFSALTKRLLRVAPAYTASSVVVLLLSQIFQIAAFLLPLKVMILLGSHGVPRYFPGVLAGVERERLILLLAAAAVVLYLAHLFMDFIGATLARKVSARIIEFELEEAAEERLQRVALNLYRRFIVVVGGATFGLMVMLFFGVYRPATLVVIVSYFIVVMVLAELLFVCFPRLLEHALAQFARLIDILSASGFLLVFGSLVVSFLYGGQEGLLLGILALLLSRQMFSRLAMALKNLERLYRDREKAFAALLRPQGLSDELYQEDDDEDVWSPGLLDGGLVASARPSGKVRSVRPYWDMVAPQKCGPLLTEMLAVVGATTVAVKQLDAGLRGQLLLHVVGQNSDQASAHFLFRLFHNNHAQAAMRAAELLSVYTGELAPSLLTTTVCNNYPAHLYRWPEDWSLVNDAQSIRECRERVFIDFGLWSVPHSLMHSGSRSGLLERCSQELWLRCQAFSRWMDEETKSIVDEFVKSPGRLFSALSELPLRVYNPDVNIGHVYVSASGFKVTYWGGWRLEPIGSGWPLELGFSRLENVFNEMRGRCEELRSLSVLQVNLAALAFEFERLCDEGTYLLAFARLREIDVVLKQLGR
ncbi:hypothetical protein ACK8QS_09380 [Ectopseudomonas mendocina]